MRVSNCCGCVSVCCLSSCSDINFSAPLAMFALCGHHISRLASIACAKNEVPIAERANGSQSSGTGILPCEILYGSCCHAL